jgi:hypothetical protein
MGLDTGTFNMAARNGTKMKRLLARMSYRQAALIAGLGLLAMLPLAIFAEFGALSNIVIKGDAAATVDNIRGNGTLFGMGLAGYCAILLLDAIVALAFYILLRQVNRKLAFWAAALRVVYASIMGMSFVALALLLPDRFALGKLVAYAFFIPHVFVLGYLVFKSGYMPRSIGILLMVASPGYIILTYGDLILSQASLNAMMPIVMLPPFLSEPLLALWLLVKGRKLQATGNQDEASGVGAGVSFGAMMS